MFFKKHFGFLFLIICVSLNAVGMEKCPENTSSSDKGITSPVSPDHELPRSLMSSDEEKSLPISPDDDSLPLISSNASRRSFFNQHLAEKICEIGGHLVGFAKVNGIVPLTLYVLLDLFKVPTGGILENAITFSTLGILYIPNTEGMAHKFKHVPQDVKNFLNYLRDCSCEQKNPYKLDPILTHISSIGWSLAVTGVFLKIEGSQFNWYSDVFSVPFGVAIYMERLNFLWKIAALKEQSGVSVPRRPKAIHPFVKTVDGATKFLDYLIYYHGMKTFAKVAFKASESASIGLGHAGAAIFSPLAVYVERDSVQVLYDMIYSSEPLRYDWSTVGRVLLKGFSFLLGTGMAISKVFPVWKENFDTHNAELYLFLAFMTTRHIIPAFLSTEDGFYSFGSRLKAFRHQPPTDHRDEATAVPVITYDSFSDTSGDPSINTQAKIKEELHSRNYKGCNYGNVLTYSLSTAMSVGVFLLTLHFSGYF